MFTLIWTKNKNKDQPEPFVFTPEDDRFVIGTHSSCDHIISAVGLSRRHCTLVRSGDSWIVEDGDGVRRSTCGIFDMSGERINSAVLQPGQSVYLLNSAEDTIVLRRNRGLTGPADDRDLTINHEINTRVLIQSLRSQTEEIEAFIKRDLERREQQLSDLSGLLNTVCDEVKRLKTDFQVASVDDGDRDKALKEQKTLTRLLAIVVGGSGLWLLVKDQQTASNIFGVVIMIGGAIGFGKSGSK
jgi:hypothetical protein